MITTLNSKNEYNDVIGMKLYYDDKLSNKLMSMVKGPQIDVFKYSDYRFLNAFTFPLQFNSRDEFFNEGETKATFVFLRSFKNILENSTVDNFNYTINNGIAHITGVKYIPICYEMHFFSKIPFEQQIAILLHEVGHNTIIKKTAITFLMQYGYVTTNLLFLLKYVLSWGDIYLPVDYRIILILRIIYGIILSHALMQPLEYHSDNFAKEMGYGQELALGLLNMSKLMKSDLKMSALNKFIFTIFGALISHPDTYDRICKLVKDPDKFIAERENDEISKKLVTFLDKIQLAYK